MLTLQQVLDLQAQNKITITMDRRDNGRYFTIRAYNDKEDEYYVNDKCMYTSNLHTKNYNKLVENAHNNYPQLGINDSIIIVEDRLFKIVDRPWTPSHFLEVKVKIKPIDGDTSEVLYRKGQSYLTGNEIIRQAIKKLVFSTDRYPLSMRRICEKVRRYKKCEIQADPSLSQETKDELCRQHSNHFVLFTGDGEYIGLYPRCEYLDNFELNPQNINTLNKTLMILFGEGAFEISLGKYEESKITEGVTLC